MAAICETKCIEVRDTDIGTVEATLDPRVWRENDAAVVVAQAQMVSDHGSDRLRLAANLLPETLGSALVLDGEKEVAFVLSS